MEIKTYIEGRHASCGVPALRNNNMTLSASCYKDSIVLRHDDGDNPAFWLQTRIDRETLLELLKQMDEAVE